MEKVIPAGDLPHELEAVLEDVREQRASYVVERDGQPHAALVPYEHYLLFRRQEANLKGEVDAMLARLAAHNAQFSEEEIEADIKEAIREVREERRR